MNIKYRQLKGFVLAAELGSFKAAAEMLAITQPSFSVLMRELEDDVGVLLFERTARKCVLTQAGALLYRDVPGILSQLEHAYRKMKDFAQGRIGSLSIATLGSLSVGVIAPTLADFKNHFPKVPVALQELRNDVIFDAVAQGRAEIGVAALLDRVPDIVFEPLFSDQLMLVTSERHPVHTASVRWNLLRDHPCILMSTGPAEYALRANKVNITPVFVVDHLSTAVTMVRHGLGVTVLPSCVLSSLNIDGLRCIPFEGDHSTRNLGVIYRNKDWLSPAALNFVRMLKELQPPPGAGWRRAAAA